MLTNADVHVCNVVAAVWIYKNIHTQISTLMYDAALNGVCDQESNHIQKKWMYVYGDMLYTLYILKQISQQIWYFIEIHAFSFKTIHLKMSCVKYPPLCPGLNLLVTSALDRE